MGPHRSNTASFPVLGVLALALAGAGCSSGEADVGGTPAADANTQATAARPAEPVDLCALMPVADVAAVLQANGADTVTKSSPGAGGMCSYRHEPTPGDYRTKLLIDFTRLRSVEMAQDSMRMQRKDYEQRGVALVEVPGLGDEAFAPERGLGASVKVRVGDYIGQVNLTVGEQQPATLQPAVLALGREVVERLPR